MNRNKLNSHRFAALLLICALPACTIAPDGPQEITARRQGLSTFILHDATTGCEYIRFGDFLIPRMQVNGQQRCVQ